MSGLSSGDTQEIQNILSLTHVDDEIKMQMISGILSRAKKSPASTEIPESEWEKVQSLADKIMRRSWEQDEDLRNLNNLLHALHGEGVRDRKYTSSGVPMIFKDGKWIPR